MAKTVEETYQKKTPLEHILLRPDTYIGSVEKETQNMYVWDDELKKIVYKNINFVPGLYKIFDEIIVNAADNKIRDSTMTTIKVDINKEENSISVYNDGKGVPIRIHATEKVYVPELIFGQLLTSSNYDDKEKKVTGGRNGYGAKLCNIFSTEFIVETADKEVGKYYKQIYKNNMGYTGKPEITKYKKSDFTRITFKPDLKRFSMDCLDDEIVSLLKKRVYDLSGIVKNVKVFLNGEKLDIKNFRQYVELYLLEQTSIVHQIINERWELAFITNEEQFHQVSFVNSICTSKGGSHVNHVVDQLCEPIIEQIKKKNKNMNVKPLQVKSSMFVFINCLIDNPAFDSQTKENLTLRLSSFGSRCEPLKEFIDKVLKNTDIVEKITRYIRAKEDMQLKKTDGSKKKKLTMDKLEDAKLAGTVNSDKCILFLTEGDSAKTLVMAGRSVVGTDILGVFPLKGKLLNVREASSSQILKNEEVVAIKKILGLQHNKEYTDTKNLRYGHVMIMTDQDHDGSHIKGLLINFFDFFYPSLLKIPGFLQEFITPIVRGRNSRGEVFDFFTVPEYEEFKILHPTYTYKYYKGLGTSTNKDAVDYFSNLDRHVKNFLPLTVGDKDLLDLAFNKKKADNRKTWLLGYEPGTFLDQNAVNISISDFVNKELILFSMADNIRSIPNVMDGFKPGQRKIMFTCFKINLLKEIKVASLSGLVSSGTAYHHGEASVNSTIVNLAQDFVGSNNINLLMPEGQFGSRLKGGKDSAAYRYIFTYLNPISRLVFHKSDDLVLNYLNEENQSIEPEFYVPIIPMVLVNGAEGIGTGWSTNIPNFNPKDIIKNIRKLLRDEPLEEMDPYYRNFIGFVTKISPGRYQVDGVWETEDNCLYITELPVGVWTSNYKTYLDSLIESNEIEGYSDQNTDKTINIKIQLKKPLKNTKLTTFVSTNNMICFNQHHKIKKYDTPEDILKEFYYVRLSYYLKRKEKLLEVLKENMLKNENKVRFIRAVVDEVLIISKRKRKDIVDELKRENYTEFDNYNYLLSMEILSLTEERINKLKKDYDESKAIYEDLLGKTPKSLWYEDLEAFEKEYDRMMELEELSYDKSRNNASKQTANSKKARRKTKNSESVKVVKTKTTVVKTGSTKITTKKNTTNETSVTRKRAKIDKKPAVKKEIKQEIEEKPTSPTRNSILTLSDATDSEGDDKVWNKY